MISGRQTLGSIDQALQQAHGQTDRLEAEIGELTQQLMAQQTAQTDDYRQLAQVRLNRLSGEDLTAQLDRTEQQVVALLSQRDNALAALQQQIADAERVREQHQAERLQQEERLDAAVSIADEAEAKTQVRLESDPAYRVQRESAEEAERRARHAADKADRSAQEREEKGKAYRDDPLFVYLWERQYGLPDYRAGNLARWLDAKVARLIGYADARANYARLNEIPQRLREHADHLRASADAAFDRLRALDESARAADGLPAREDEVAREQQTLDDIDQRIEQSEQGYRALLDQKARFAAGDDEFTGQAVEYLANELRRDDLAQLRLSAFNTPYPEDDVIVARMLQRDDEKTQLQTSVDGLKSARDEQQKRLVELESLRLEFKRHRYDRTGSVFANDSMIPVLLGQFLAGMLDRGMLWKVLQEQQRYRPQRSDPRFGSGGFGRGTVWTGGMGDLGDIIGKLGRGGFGRRGGGTGGGGFRTGGGF